MNEQNPERKLLTFKLSNIYQHWLGLRDGEIQPKHPQIVPWEQGVRWRGFMNKTVMSKNLLDFKKIMDKYNVPFVLIYGTLLGVVRNNDFISNDTDVDVACFFHTNLHNENNMIFVKKEMSQLGFDIVNNDCMPYNWDVFIRNGEKIEIWWYQKIDKEWIFNNIYRYPEQYFDRLDTVSFLGKNFKVPYNRLIWLELTYGLDWRIPVSKDSGDGNPRDMRPEEVLKRQRKEEIIKIVREELRGIK